MDASSHNGFKALVARSVPERVEVAGVPLRIVHSPKQKTHGQFCCDAQTIWLAELSGEDAWRTLWHEMGHAAFAYTGMGEVLAAHDPALEEAFMTLWDHIALPAVVATTLADAA